MNQNYETTKKIVAKSTASYRGIQILETEKGAAVIVGMSQYDLADLDEATAFIDALYANAARRVTMGEQRTQ